MRSMIRYYSLIFFLFWVQQAVCQPVVDWAKPANGTSNAFAQSIATDAHGNSYVAGSFSGTVDFDPGPSTYNLSAPPGSDAFIYKLDSSGNFLWAKSVSASLNQLAEQVAIDTFGNVTVMGYFEGSSVDFNPGPGTFNMSSAGSRDVFILNLDSMGNFLWAKRIGSTGQDEAWAGAKDGYGNIYVTGFYALTVDFNPGTGVNNLTSVGNTDVFVLKLDKNGNFAFAKSLGGSSSDHGRSISADADQNIYVTGKFYGTADFDPSPSSYLLSSPMANGIFVTRLNSYGNLEWAHAYVSNTGGGIGLEVIPDKYGSVYATGNFNGAADFDHGPDTCILSVPTTTSGSFILKLDTAGNFKWAKQLQHMGVNPWSIAFSLITDAYGNILVGGEFINTIDFNLGTDTFSLTNSAGHAQTFLMKIDPYANFLWALHFDAEIEGDNSCLLALDAQNNIYTTGYFQGTADLDPGPGVYSLIATGNADPYAMKLVPCVIDSVYQLFECDFHILYNDTLTHSGTYMYAKNDAGCEKQYVLNLTITHADTLVEVESCLDFVFNNDTISTPGTYFDTLITINGCDSIVTLNYSHPTLDTGLHQQQNTLVAHATNVSYQWLNCEGPFPLPGETDSSFAPPFAAPYAVEVSFANCIDTSACFPFVPDDISTIEADLFSIYPNPFSKSFTLQFVAGISEVDLSIYNATGGLIWKQTLYNQHKSTPTIFTPDIPAGVYLMNVLDNHRSTMVKLIKQ